MLVLDLCKSVLTLVLNSAPFLIILIHREFLALWRLRNERRHGSDASERNEIRRERYIARAKKVQEIARQLTDKRDRELLEWNTDLAPWPTSRIVAFVTWAEDLAAFCAKESGLYSAPARDRTSDEVTDPP